MDKAHDGTGEPGGAPSQQEATLKGGAPRQMTLAAACQRLLQLVEMDRVDKPVTTRFRLRGMEFEARLSEDVLRHIVLRLTTCLGYLPFTAENEWNRRSIMELARDAAKDIRATLKIDKANKVWMIQETCLDHHPEPSEFMTLLTQLALHLTPMLDALSGRTIPVDGSAPAKLQA
ncbi:MAG: hypothetical protein ACOY99_02960 [Pseudomonadota bacterium]